MKSASVLMKNTLMLAASNILMRLIAISFQSYLAASVGAAQLGVFGIITSVATVFATISISGVRFSVTRLAAEESGRGNEYPLRLMGCAFLYGGIFGCGAGAFMYATARWISFHYIGDVGAMLPLRVMALSMPWIALGGCVEGYFSAKQKVLRLISVQFLSQAARIAFVAINMPQKSKMPADILAGGYFIGEICFALGMLLLFVIENYGKKDLSQKKPYFKALVKTAAPLAVSAYMRTGLSSLGQVIIPRGLKKAGMGSAGAFATYGIITQMALPIVMFPAALLGALGDILIPRLTEAQVNGQKIGISYIVNRALRIGTIFSFGVMGVMLFYADGLGELIYKSGEAGFYIKTFAPLIPVIYIDSVTDGCLKGLGQQVYSMAYNVIEGAVNVCLLYFFLPRGAMLAYIAVMYIKEVLNAVLSINRLRKVTEVELQEGSISVIFCTLGAWLIGAVISPSGVILKITVYIAAYITLLYIFSAITRDDIKWILSNVSIKKA